MKNSIYYQMNEKERTLLNEVMEITNIDYDIIGEFIPVGNLISALYEMVYEFHNKEDELKDLKNDIRDNYTRKCEDEYEFYGVSRNDF